MKLLGICAIAKNENAYIDEWVRYHIMNGVDHIWLYDNNDLDTPYVGDCISENYKEYVTIVDNRGLSLGNIPNASAYNDFLENYSQEVEWCAFIDIDEFIVCKEGVDLRGWLLEAPEFVRFVKLYWKIYGDNNMIEGEESVPVMERFTEESSVVRYRGLYKTLMRCGDVEDIICGNAHCFHMSDGFLPPYVDSIFSNEEYRLNTANNLPVHINHYMTKSLSEFIKYKVNRVSDEYGTTDKINYFFIVNERTAEKERYVEEHLDNNGEDVG